MDAADDPDEAQLWAGPRNAKPSAIPAAAKGLFDVFAPDGSGVDGAPVVLPPTAAVFDMAASDASALPCLVGQGYGDQHMQDTPCAQKKMQDDHSTLLPPTASWHDVSQDDVDFTGFSFGASYDAMDRGGHAVHDSSDGLLEHSQDFQCGPWLAHARATLPDVFPASDVDSDTDGSHDGRLDSALSTGGSDADDTHLKDFQSHADRRTQCEPLPPTPDGEFVLKDFGSRSGDTLGFGATPSVAASYHAWSGNGMATPGVLPKDFGSLDHDLGTQCGQLPQPSCSTLGCSQTPQTQLPAKDFGSLDHDLGTQCGPLPQPACGTLGWTQTPQTQLQNIDFGSLDHDLGTQCGPLPLADDLSFDGFTIFDLDLDSSGLPVSRTLCGHLSQQPPLRTSTEDDALKKLQPQSPHTHCGHLPQPHALADVDSFMLQYWQEHQALVQAFNARADAHHSSMPTFKDVDNSEARMRDLTPPEYSTRLAPDPSRLKDFSVDASSLHFVGTQCGPLPQQQNPRGSDRVHQQLGPSYLQVAKDLKSKTQRTQCGPLPSSDTPRTQCGPLPQQPSSVPLGTQSGPPAKGKGKGGLPAKGKGKGKTNGKRHHEGLHLSVR